MRHLTRRGPVFIAGRLGLQASIVGRVLRSHRMPLLLRELDPVTGTVIRATRHSANRYEHDHPRSLIHVDVKKLGRIADGGGWRADPTQTTAVHRSSRKFIRPHWLWTIGKVEGLNRTFAAEWAYARPLPLEQRTNPGLVSLARLLQPG